MASLVSFGRLFLTAHSPVSIGKIAPGQDFTAAMDGKSNETTDQVWP
jgi:hypothetical protein